MKHAVMRLRALLTSIGLAAGGFSACGQNFLFNNLDLTIPDGDPAGVVDVQVIDTESFPILDISVTLEISGVDAGGYNGDLYVALQHDSGFSVLLNRVGRREENLSGYADNGFSITLDDSAPSGDIHSYRMTLEGSHTTPIPGPLTGVWQPDARNVDPDSVLDTSPRTAGLSAFEGLDPRGEWTLFIADMEEGGQMRLESWGLIITVPEPGTGVLTAMGLLALTLLGRRSGRTRPARIP